MESGWLGERFYLAPRRLWNGIRDHGECVEGATFPFDDDSGLSNGVVFGRAAIADPDMT